MEGRGTGIKTQVSIGLWAISKVLREGFHEAERWGTTEVKDTEKLKRVSVKDIPRTMGGKKERKKQQKLRSPVPTERQG